MNEIRDPVERDEYGCWTHPEYEKFCDGREYISTEEFNTWMKANNLQWTICSMDEDYLNPVADDPDISAWEPERPEGEGWFIGSIHDTEDGPVCVWFKQGDGIGRIEKAKAQLRIMLAGPAASYMTLRRRERVALMNWKPKTSALRDWRQRRSSYLLASTFDMDTR